MSEHKFTPEQVIVAIQKSNGLITHAARKLKVTRQTVKNYVDKYPEVKAALDEMRDVLIDEAESALVSAVKRKEAWAISLVLKTIGKERGYVERQEVTGKDGAPIPVAIVKMDVSDL